MIVRNTTPEKTWNPWNPVIKKNHCTNAFGPNSSTLTWPASGLRGPYTPVLWMKPPWSTTASGYLPGRWYINGMFPSAAAVHDRSDASNNSSQLKHFITFFTISMQIYSFSMWDPNGSRDTVIFFFANHGRPLPFLTTEEASTTNDRQIIHLTTPFLFSRCPSCTARIIVQWTTKQDERHEVTNNKGQDPDNPGNKLNTKSGTAMYPTWAQGHICNQKASERERIW